MIFVNDGLEVGGWESGPNRVNGLIKKKCVRVRVRIIKDEFLKDFLTMYIEREVVATISIDSIIDDFQD
jgi:hypothetical protein